MPSMMLTEVTVLARGSSATAGVAIAGTVVPVEATTQFDGDGGRLDICGIQYDYLTVDEDASTITLATGLTVAVSEFDPVSVVAGGEVVQKFSAVLDPGAGDNITIEIPFAWRAQLPEGLYDPPVPVTVSADQTEILDLPGRAPVLAAGYIDEDGATTAPIVSPAILAYGMPSSIVLRSDPVAPSTKIEYHVSTSSFVPTAGDPTTLIGDATRSLVLVVTELPDGSLLQLDTSYYFHTIAFNNLGAADPSVEVIQKLDPTAISQVIAAEVIAGFVLAGLIQVGSITIDPDGGINIPLANGGLISLPADGTSALFRKVIVEADSLLVYDNFELRGASNRIAGTLALAGSIVAPTTGPTVGQGWDAPGISVTAQVTSSAYLGLNDDGTNWVTVHGASVVLGIDKTTGVVSTLLAAPAGLGVVAVAKQGTDWYALCKTIATGVMVVRKYNASWVYSGTQFNAPTAGVTPATTARSIACDGTTLYYGFVNTNTAAAVIRSSTLAGGSVATVLTTADFPSVAEPLYVGTADFGAQRFVIGSASSTHVYTSAGAVVVTQQWASPVSGTINGIHYDGANFYCMSGRTVWKMSPVVTSTARSVRYSQYDATGTTHETAWSPGTAYTQPARSWMRVSTPGPQDAGGVDDPDTIRHYIQNSGAGSWFRQTDVTVSPWTVWYGVPSTAGSTAVSTPDFSGISNPGVVSSSATDSFPSVGTPLAYIKGNGEARLSDLVVAHIELNTPNVQSAASTTLATGTATLMRWMTTPVADATGTITNPNTAVTSDGRIVLGASGLYQIELQYTFGSNTTGTRRLRLLMNAGASIIATDSKAPAPTDGTTVSVSFCKRFAAGDYFTTELLQASGGNLAAFSSAEGFCRLHVTRIGR